MLQVAVVGLGIAGHRHLKAYKGNPHVDIVAVSDVDKDKALAAGQSYDAQAFEDYHELLSQRPDAVSICLPHAYLSEAALAAGEHGVNTLVEKPMALSTNSAQAVGSLFRSRGLVLMVGYVHRFRSEVRQAIGLIRDGAIGDVYLVMDRSSMGGDERAPNWIWDPDISGGGVLMYNGVHSIDRILWALGGMPTRIRATRAAIAHDSPVEDFVEATLEFEGGSRAQLLVHFPPFSEGSVWTTDFYGTQGALRISTETGLLVNSRLAVGVQEVPPVGRFDAEIAEFVGAIRGGRKPSPGDREGLRALEIVEHIYSSSREGGVWVVRTNAGQIYQGEVEE